MLRNAYCNKHIQWVAPAGMRRYKSFHQNVKNLVMKFLITQIISWKWPIDIRMGIVDHLDKEFQALADNDLHKIHHSFKRFEVIVRDVGADAVKVASVHHTLLLIWTVSRSFTHNTIMDAVMNPCSECFNILDDHPHCKAECAKQLSLKDSKYAKLKLEYQQAHKKLKQLESENSELQAELKRTRQLACTLQCEIQSLVENCTTGLAKMYPYMEAPTCYLSQSLQPRNNETMLAELLRVEKAICARYKAKADTVDALQRELAAFKAKAAAKPKRHDVVFNLNLMSRNVYPMHPLSNEELDAQGRFPGTTSRWACTDLEFDPCIAIPFIEFE